MLHRHAEKNDAAGFVFVVHPDQVFRLRTAGASPTRPGIDDDDFVKINPRRQIPALILDDGECLTETVAILMYLADKYPQSNLAPLHGTLERARLDQWMCFVLANGTR